jgi:hypothetical protein
MTAWLCCLALTIKVLCLNNGTTRHRMNLDKSLTVVCLRSPGRTLRQTNLVSRAAASHSCRKNIGFSKLSSDSTLYRKVAERRVILSFFLSSNDPLPRGPWLTPCNVSPTLDIYDLSFFHTDCNILQLRSFTINIDEQKVSIQNQNIYRYNLSFTM